jgi:catechol 2,3-dioxygenase
VAVVRADEPGLDHFSFDVEDWGALKTWADRFAAGGVQLAWGPGRHGPGNNLFVMVEDADGRRVELSAEMEQFWDDRAGCSARDWVPAPTTTNLWGPNPAWRTLAVDVR